MDLTNVSTHDLIEELSKRVRAKQEQLKEEKAEIEEAIHGLDLAIKLARKK